MIFKSASLDISQFRMDGCYIDHEYISLGYKYHDDGYIRDKNGNIICRYFKGIETSEGFYRIWPGRFENISLLEDRRFNVINKFQNYLDQYYVPIFTHIQRIKHFYGIENGQKLYVNYDYNNDGIFFTDSNITDHRIDLNQELFDEVNKILTKKDRYSFWCHLFTVSLVHIISYNYIQLLKSKFNIYDPDHKYVSFIINNRKYGFLINPSFKTYLEPLHFPESNLEIKVPF